jgi:hypothetical protein
MRDMLSDKVVVLFSHCSHHSQATHLVRNVHVSLANKVGWAAGSAPGSS